MSLFNREKGIYLERRKNTRDMSVVQMTLPERVFIPMTQGLCPASVPCVKPGDRVTVGQLVGKAAHEDSVPVHSSVSGTVTAIGTRMSRFGLNDVHIEIETDGRQSVSPDIMPPEVNDRDDFVKALENSGIVCPDGRSMISALCLDGAEPADIDTLIVDASEGEPYVTSGYRNLLAFSKDALAGAARIMKHLGIGRCIFAVGADKSDAAALLRNEAEGFGNIEVRTLSAVYPSGDERSLILALTGRKLMPGKHPRSLRVLILNAETVIRMMQYLKTGMPYVSTTLTVDGSAVAEPMNVEVPIGTLYEDVLDFCRADAENAGKLMISGPMTGTALPSADIAVTKADDAAILLSKLHAARDRQTACINCGQCLRACPAGLAPVVLMKAWNKRDLAALADHRISACTSCGCCSYVCPARRQLSFELSLARDWAEKTREGRDE